MVFVGRCMDPGHLLDLRLCLPVQHAEHRVPGGIDHDRVVRRKVVDILVEVMHAALVVAPGVTR